LIVNPLQLIPPVVAAAVCAPLATVLFNFRATYTVGGLGLNSFIAPIYFWGQVLAHLQPMLSAGWHCQH
jgi:uncharacterized membrane protein